jgi:glutaredoxin 3
VWTAWRLAHTRAAPCFRNSYCTAVKGLFAQLNVNAKIIELDKLGASVNWRSALPPGESTDTSHTSAADGTDQQNALAELTSQRTVPNVFIGGKHVGGNDATQALHRDGKLNAMLKAAGAI